MADLSFPRIPLAPPVPPVQVVHVVRRDPLSAIREALALTVDDVVNDRRHKRAVYEMYRVTRRIEVEGWLRSRLLDLEAEAWIAAHL